MGARASLALNLVRPADALLGRREEHLVLAKDRDARRPERRDRVKNVGLVDR